MSATAIEWADHVWNPVAGCTRVSPGCDHCYAATMTRRLESMGKADYSGLTTHKHFNGKINLLPNKLDVPLRRKKPTRWFVNSMSDLFHKDVPFEFIDKVFSVMAVCPQHQFLVLTKRPERMVEYFSGYRKSGLMPCLKTRFKDMPDGGVLIAPLPNVWLGVSVENQEQANWRIPLLWKTPAAILFLSCEPLLSAIDFRRSWRCSECGGYDAGGIILSCSGCGRQGRVADWCIVGGESGPGARPCNISWVRSIVEQCKSSGVPCFVKQLGSVPAMRADTLEGRVSGDHPEQEWTEGTRFGTYDAKLVGTEWQGRIVKLKDKKGGDMDEWPGDLRVREFPLP